MRNRPDTYKPDFNKKLRLKHTRILTYQQTNKLVVVPSIKQPFFLSVVCDLKSCGSRWDTVKQYSVERLERSESRDRARARGPERGDLRLVFVLSLKGSEGVGCSAEIHSVQRRSVGRTRASSHED